VLTYVNKLSKRRCIRVDTYKVSQAVFSFGQSYTKTLSAIIKNTECTDLDKGLFMKNCCIPLTNIKMTGAAPFRGIRFEDSTGKVLDPERKLEDARNAQL
jgi:hypothetical protein